MRWLAAGGPALAVALLVAACATPSTLTRDGEQVTLRGVLQGQGKLGYVLLVDGQEIYLDIDEDLSPHYGESATVRGTLRHVDPAAAADLPDACTPQAPCAVPPALERLTDVSIEFEG